MNWWGLLAVAAAYLVGSIPAGLLLGRWRGVDVRRIGSGNIGATNVMRATGKVAGVLTFLLDGAKGAAVPLLALFLGLPVAWAAAAGLAAVTGHCFSLFLGLRGGKGVATLVGAFAVLEPLSAAAAAIGFGLSLAVTRYVAVSSMVLALTLLAAVAWRCGVMEPRTLVALGCAGLVAVRHQDNWRRLRHGSEGKAFTGGEEGGELGG